VPSIKTRRAETTLEIPSGGSMAMAGLIQDQTKQAINGLPGLSTLPVLGALFRSRDYRQQPDRADGAGDALYRSGRRAEGPVASG
jgi:Flp pilus assembly secretin CpaC